MPCKQLWCQRKGEEESKGKREKSIIKSIQEKERKILSVAYINHSFEFCVFPFYRQSGSCSLLTFPLAPQLFAWHMCNIGPIQRKTLLYPHLFSFSSVKTVAVREEEEDEECSERIKMKWLDNRLGVDDMDDRCLKYLFRSSSLLTLFFSLPPSLPLSPLSLSPFFFLSLFLLSLFPVVCVSLPHSLYLSLFLTLSLSLTHSLTHSLLQHWLQIAACDRFQTYDENQNFRKGYRGILPQVREWRGTRERERENFERKREMKRSL